MSTEVDILRGQTVAAIEVLQQQIVALELQVNPPPPEPTITPEEQKAILLDSTQHWDSGSFYQQGETVQHEGFIYTSTGVVLRNGEPPAPVPGGDPWLLLI